MWKGVPDLPALLLNSAHSAHYFPAQPRQANNANLGLLLPLEALKLFVGELEGLAVVGDLVVGEGVDAVEEEALVP